MPGPVSGTAPEPAVEVSAPAPSSSETTAPEVTETAAAEPTSVLSDAQPAPEPETPPAPPEAEAPAAEEKPPPEAEAKPPEPLPAPVYEPFTLPEGVQLEDEKLGAFTGMLGEFENRIATDPTQAHAVMQEMGQRLLDTHLAELQDQHQRLTRLNKDNWDRLQEDRVAEFRSDPEIGGNRQDTTISRMGALLKLYGQQQGSDAETAARVAFAASGAGNDVRVLRFVNWAASRLVETPRPVPAVVPKPVPSTRSRAERLYPSARGVA